MGLVTLSELYYVSTGDIELVLVDCADHLGTETISGTPTMTEITTTDLTISSVQATTAALTIKGRSVTAAQAVQALVQGFVAESTYNLKMTAVTHGSPSRTFSRQLTMVCK